LLKKRGLRYLPEGKGRERRGKRLRWGGYPRTLLWREEGRRQVKHGKDDLRAHYYRGAPVYDRREGSQNGFPPPEGARTTRSLPLIRIYMSGDGRKIRRKEL